MMPTSTTPNSTTSLIRRTRSWTGVTGSTTIYVFESMGRRDATVLQDSLTTSMLRISPSRGTMIGEGSSRSRFRCFRFSHESSHWYAVPRAFTKNRTIY